MQLRCQDKGQASEIIFHSQTLNYPVRLDQIQSKGEKKEKQNREREREREREGKRERGPPETDVRVVILSLVRDVKEAVAMVMGLDHFRQVGGCGL